MSSGGKKRRTPAQQFGGAFVLISLLTLGLVVATVWVILGAYSTHLHEEQILRDGVKTSAIVTDSIPHTYTCGRTTCTEYYVYYSFSDSQGRSHDTHFVYSRSQPIGESIRLAYLPSDPTQQVPTTEVTTIGSIWFRFLVLLGGIGFLGFLTFNIWNQFMRAYQKQISAGAQH